MKLNKLDREYLKDLVTSTNPRYIKINIEENGYFSTIYEDSDSVGEENRSAQISIGKFKIKALKKFLKEHFFLEIYENCFINMTKLSRFKIEEYSGIANPEGISIYSLNICGWFGYEFQMFFTPEEFDRIHEGFKILRPDLMFLHEKRKLKN